MPGRPTNEPLNYFALGVQSAKNTEATTFHFFKHLAGSQFDTEFEVQSEYEGGDGQEVGLRYKTMHKADGAVNINARPGGAGRLLAWTLGADSVASVTNFQDHTITPLQASQPFLTADERWADALERTSNIQVTQLSITGEAGRPIKFQGQFLSAGTAYERPVASALTAAREVGDPFFFPYASIYRATAQGDTAGAHKITKFEMVIKRRVDDGIQTDTLVREDVVPLAFDVDVNWTEKYEDRQLYRQAYYGGGSQVPLDITTTAFGFISYEGSTFLRCEAPQLHFIGAKPNRLDPDGKTMYIDAAAMSYKGATYSFWSQVRDGPNATAAYTT